MLAVRVCGARARQVINPNPIVSTAFTNRLRLSFKFGVHSKDAALQTNKKLAEAAKAVISNPKIFFRLSRDKISSAAPSINTIAIGKIRKSARRDSAAPSGTPTNIMI